MKPKKLVWRTFEDSIENCIKYNVKVIQVLSMSKINYLNLNLSTEIHNSYTDDKVLYFNAYGTVYIDEKDYEKVTELIETHFEEINDKSPNIIYVLFSWERFTDIEKNDWNSFLLPNSPFHFYADEEDIPLSVFRQSNIKYFVNENEDDMLLLDEVIINQKGEYEDIYNKKKVFPKYD